MKQVITLLTSLFLLSGCLILNNEGEDSAIESRGAHLLRDVYLYEKKEQDLLWTLIDDRTGEEVISIHLSELDYQVGKGIDKQKAARLAKELALGIDQSLINPSITREGIIKPGRNRVILSEQELVDKLLSLAYSNKRLLLPIYTEEPKVTVEDLELIKNSLLSTYSTNFNPNVVGRSVNIKLSSQAIDHYVIGPNEIFSFNKVVGQRTKERGYQEAIEIINKEFVTGIGGGICQTSSTLFNAIDGAGLEVVERYSHSREIGYVPANRDATVSWGGPDFKFRNNYDIPLLITTETNLQTGKIEVQVYGPSVPGKLLVTTD
ncbi:VanW family protein [Anaerobacillus sp. CMMVII]|uniref:VanW family protein n=1 Tax=Anaerobacillus sp. CMMVII TaxID=2755588 RepID=UPI0021B78159|nr:VanW family protein [Anaerobacillus sp. CMMVII]MCT8138838.1 VanW family protein [Anaerobacillus sp. CMMVII]